MAITQNDRYEWAHHPVTKEFLGLLHETREDTKEAWAREKFTAGTIELSAVTNAAALGGISVLDQAIGIIEGHQADDGSDAATELPKTHSTSTL